MNPESLRICLVENHGDTAELLVLLLTQKGHQVAHASTCAQARALLDRDGFDVLLSDIGLPGGVSGKQLADAARATRPRLKVILITGYAQEAMDADLVAQGIELLRKPVLIDVLLRKVQDVLKAGD